MEYDITLNVPTRLFTPDYCWAQPRLGAIPPGVPGNPGPDPLVVLALQKVGIEGSDLFQGLEMMRTADLGAHWDGPTPIPMFERERLPSGDETVICDFTPRWHAASGRLLGTGAHIRYYKGEVVDQRYRAIAYAFYDAEAGKWGPPRFLELPDFPWSGAGSTQRFDLPDGTILLPVFVRKPEDKTYSTLVIQCRVVGEQLELVASGNAMTVPEERGLYEPSVTEFRGRFYLTMRNDLCGYVAVSDDGLHFSKPTPWLWEDGTELGSYNTQQHWVRHRQGLYLVYTRRGAENDHVFRHRAPLFMAQVCPETLRVVKESERALMPNRGARLGNFAVAEVSPQETWVSDAEWMQPRGCERYGSDGSVWVSRIRWAEPNA